MQAFLTVLYKKIVILYKKIVKMHHFAPFYHDNLQSPHFKALLFTKCNFHFVKLRR